MITHKEIYRDLYFTALKIRETCKLKMSQGLDNIRWKFIEENTDFFRWASAVIAGKETIKAMHEYVRITTIDALVKWPDDEKKHLKQFVRDNLIFPGQTLKNVKCKCELCKKVFDRIIKHKMRNEEPIVLFGPAGPSWLTFLKFFLPKGSKDIDSLENCDETLLCKILDRCLLFDDLEHYNEIVDMMNSLVHSPKQVLSSEKSNECFRKMESFLIQCPNAAAALKQVKECETKLCELGIPTQAYNDLTKAGAIIKECIKRDMQLLQSSKEPILEKIDPKDLLRIMDEQESLIKKLKKTDKRFDATLDQITAMGAQEGSKEFGDGIIGITIGRFSGAAGARAAGRFKKKNLQ